ncbi:SET domain-containing protein/zf-MYND domain-containing protein [Cephalotus follicularis]|uniref:SET domain-containing protein/zf-MYND domain-containing protein n=1 Tax=Cephalotus follicularis TaxID=3775 RepID=A0A1Q3C7G7_CEPFO|nr:SET domain-containing protein/zf-MYND domain-containing protein [Cephalotus follicularis]
MEEELKSYLQERGLKVTTDPMKGRCLFTIKEFHPGDVIISQEPYVFVPHREFTNSVCHFCFAVTEVKMCSACHYVWYCSRECQKLDWKLHRLECRALKTLEKQWQIYVLPTIRLNVRLYIRRKLQNEKVIPTTAVDNFNLVEALVAHLSSIGADRMALFYHMANIVNNILPWSDLQETAENISKLEHNTVNILDSEMEPLGMGLYPLIAITNHSCVPNSVLVFEGKLAVIRALQHIPRDSEVSISYIDTASSTMTRQSELQERHSFTCTCPLCCKVDEFDDMEEGAALHGYHCMDYGCNGILLSNSADADFICQQCGRARTKKVDKKLLKKMKSKLAKARDAMASNRNEEALSLLMMHEKMQRQLCHPLSVLLMQARDGLIMRLMQQDDWLEALEYCRLTIPVYERVYPGFHPSLGVRYYLCGKLEWLAGEREKAITLLTKAVDVLRVTHGSDVPFMKDLFMKLEKAESGDPSTISASDMVKLRRPLPGASIKLSVSELATLANALAIEMSGASS